MATHFVQAKSILSARNGMNLYRGCVHGCIYCDSRSTCYHMEHDFEDIEVKENAVELLEEALKRKRKKCMISTGSMTDPYIPPEMELGNVRRALELIAEYGFGVTILTKSGAIVRDLDLLQEINRKAKCVVQITLTTSDEALCRKLEPNVSTTAERIETLRRFRDAGIPTVVWMCPILPFINDTAENISALLDACAGAGVYGVINFGMGLTLREGNRAYFYHQLDRLFPHLKDKYIRLYGDSYEVLSPDNGPLTALFHKLCGQYGLVHDNRAIFEYLSAFEDKTDAGQFSLFDDGGQFGEN